MTKKEYNKDNPHKDIGKQKFRVRKSYNVWVEYVLNKEGAFEGSLSNPALPAFSGSSQCRNHSCAHPGC